MMSFFSAPLLTKNRAATRLVTPLIAIVALLYASSSFALSCKIQIPVRNDTFPLQGTNITVGNELPLGTIVYKQEIKSTKDYAKAPYGMCDGTGPYTDRQYLYLTATPMALSSWQGGTYSGKIFNTNVPGIGVAIASGPTGINTTPFQWYSETRNSIGSIQVWRVTTVYLIKTGNIVPGTVTGASLPTVQYRNDYTQANGSKVLFSWKPYTFKFSGSLKIVSQTCKTSDFLVDHGIMGRYYY